MDQPNIPDFATLFPHDVNAIEEVKINYNLIEEND
jgi:hypothetical protein